MILVATVIVGAGIASAASEPAPKDKLFIVQFSTGPSWTAGKPPPEQPRFKEHGANLKRLRDEGRISFGARFSDKGMIVVRFPTEDAARREIAADPGVQAGTFVFELWELRPFYEGCLELRSDAPPSASPPPSVALPPVLRLPGGLVGS